MSWLDVAVAGGAVAGGLIQSQGAKSAASTQAQGGQAAIAEMAREFDIAQQNLAPYLSEGKLGLAQLDADFGPGGAGSKPFNFDITTDPGYQFRLDQGNKQIESSAAAKGMQLSSANLKDLIQFGSDYASGEFNSAFTRDLATKQNLLSTDMARVGVGTGATNTSVGAGGANATNIGNTLTGIANAQAGGIVGSSNAIGGAVGGIGNAFLLSSVLGQNKQPSTSPSLGGALDPSSMMG